MDSQRSFIKDFIRIIARNKPDMAEEREFSNKGQGTKGFDETTKSMWIFEPHVAENTFEQYIKENKIEVIRNEYLDRSTGGVTKKSGAIVAFKSFSGNTY